MVRSNFHQLWDAANLLSTLATIQELCISVLTLFISFMVYSSLTILNDNSLEQKQVPFHKLLVFLHKTSYCYFTISQNVTTSEAGLDYL